MIILEHYVKVLLTKMLIWAPFSQSMRTFSFCINQWLSELYPLVYFISAFIICEEDPLKYKKYKNMILLPVFH